MSQPTKGTRVRMLTLRYWHREGTVAGTVLIDGGGAGPRIALLVDLEARGRAAARRVRCYPSSVGHVQPAGELL